MLMVIVILLGRQFCSKGLRTAEGSRLWQVDDANVVVEVEEVESLVLGGLVGVDGNLVGLILGDGVATSLEKNK